MAKASKPNAKIVVADQVAPKTKKAVADEKRAVKQSQEAKMAKTNTSRREKFEANNPERFQGVESLSGHVTHRQTYRDMGLGVRQEVGENVPGQQAFPGMEHPATVNNPTRWEDLHPRVQARIERSAAKFGVTRESATRALGAQVDQAALHEQRQGGQHASFYAAETDPHDSSVLMAPRTRLKVSAAENNVPFEQQAIANSRTSPKSKFVVEPKSGPNKGKRIYPNDINATAAVKAALEHRPQDARAVPGIGGLHGNSRRAAFSVEDMQAGASAREAWSNPGAKTGPYHNSWVDPHGPDQFWVSDIHSGGGAFAPHLTHHEREHGYLKIAGIHAFNDHIARQVAAERGIPSLTGMQSMQWNEERRYRDSKARGADRGGSGTGTATDASTLQHQQSHEVIGHQTALFGGHTEIHRPVPAVVQEHLAAHHPEPPQEITTKDEYVGNIIAQKKAAKRGAELLSGRRTAPSEGSWGK